MSTPDISPRSVRAALRQLSSERTLTDSPLTDLVLVTRSLERLGRPINRPSRQWALGQVLSEAIEAELARLRQHVPAAVPWDDRARATARSSANGHVTERVGRPDPAVAEALDRLRHDFQRDDPALEGCSAVYHLFLRPDLGLSTSRLAALVAGRHARTVQRRLGLGLELISRRLHAREAAAVADVQRQRLLERLPSPAGGRLFGTDEILADLGAWLADPTRPHVLVLSGPAGSGKSTVAAACVRRLVDPAPAAPTAPRVAWLRPVDRRPRLAVEGETAAQQRAARPRAARPAVLEAAPSTFPTTATTIGQWRAAELGAARLGAVDLGEIDLGEIDFGESDFGEDKSGEVDVGAAAQDPTWRDATLRTGRSTASVQALRSACTAIGSQPGALLVIDGVDDAREMWALARGLGRLRAAPRVLITSRLGWGAFAMAETVVLPPLDRGAALALLRNEGRRRGLPSLATASDTALAALLGAAAGHPGALLLAVSELRTAPIDRVTARFQAGIGRVGDLYNRLWAGPWRSAPVAVQRTVDAVAALERAGVAADASAIAAHVGMRSDDVEAALCAALDLGLMVVADGVAARFNTPPFLATWRAGGGGAVADR